MTRLAVVITVSDSVAAGTRQDASGPIACRRLRELGFTVEGPLAVPDEQPAISELLRAHARRAALVVTTGGTGFGPRDVTPEATRAVLEREAPGLAELLRAEGRTRTPFAALSRGVVGLVGSCLVINLPGSPKAVDEGFDVLAGLLPHALELLAGHTRHDPAG